MTHRFMHNILGIALVAAVMAVSSCGKSDDGGDTSSKSSGGKQTASSVAPVGETPLKSILKASGFKPVFHRPFPSQVPGMKSEVVVYHANSGSGGGVLYTQKYGEENRVVWHWYFHKDAPDSIAAIELNEDGLWDVRMYVGSKTHDYVQEQSFTFVARQREDRLAMNGEASEPVDASAMAWKCFDGDTATAWRSPARGAFIEVHTPLGTDAGILTIQLLAEEQPASIELKADGKTVQEFDLEPTSLPQMIQLEDAARDAKTLRLVIKSSHGGAKNVAISELGVR